MKRTKKSAFSIVLAVFIGLALISGTVPAAYAAEGDVPFAAENLTLTPGSNESAMGFTWYSDRESNPASSVQIARKADLTGGEFPTGGTITVAGTAGDAAAGKSWHKASVAGLDLETEYVYRVSNGSNGYSETYSFKTGAAGDFQFIAVGDPQLTTGNQDSDSVWPNPVWTTRAGWIDTLNKISQFAPNAAFMAGTGDQVDTATNEDQYTNYFAPKQLRCLPVAPAVGNHEGTAPNFGWHFNVPNETGSSNKPDAFGNYWYTYNNSLFVVLNTAPYPANAAEAAPYIAIMDETLKAATEANPGCKWLFVQHHKSTASPASHQTDSDVLVWAPLFNALMDKYSVDFVLAGHDHVYSRSWVIKDSKKVDADYSSNSITNPNGTIYFTFTTASGLKYYDFLPSAPAAPAWVSDIAGLYTERLSGPSSINGKPWYTNVGIQVKAPQFTTVDVTDGSVTFKTYRTDSMAVIDEYTVKKTEPGTVYASVSVDPESDIDGVVEFALSLRGAGNVLTVEADAVIDGSMLAGIGVEAASGFTAMGDVLWSYI
ncbi:MAG: metallophosphoesterase family protein, partial [Clostridiales bacterium]|nr:metallophosphoesterase family protein [Clostridiales bacterium]